MASQPPGAATLARPLSDGSGLLAAAPNGRGRPERPDRQTTKTLNRSGTRTIASSNRRSIFMLLFRIGRSVQSGAFINHMWGDEGTVLAAVQMFLVRLFMIWPLQALAPTAYVYWSWQIYAHMRGHTAPARPRPTGWWPALRSTTAWLGRESLRVWLAVEALFHLYYRFKHWQLESRKASAPLMPPGKTMEALRKALDTVEMIQAGGRLAEPQITRGRSMPLLTAWQEQHHPSPSPSAQDLQDLLRTQEHESSVEQLLRDWEEAQHAAASVDFDPVAVPDSERAAVEQLVDQAEILTMKRAEACGWFMRAPACNERWPLSQVGDLRRENVREWIAWAFFHCEIGEVPSPREAELDELADEIIRWIDMDVQPGYNPQAHAMRLTMDPIPCAHRPLFYYAVTHAIFSQVISIHMRGLGFQPRHSGTMLYWHRRGRSEAGAGGEEGLPIVFCHGIGVNLLPYRPFLDEMLRRMPERTFFCLSLPHISMRIKEEVPSATEMVACISDMLASAGYFSAHFVGHSFGSLPMAWMARKQPAFVGSMTFIDPVCFLLIKPDVCYNFMYRKPATPTQLLIHYFLARELFIAHSLSRNFFWHQNQLWPEELPGPALVVLSGHDSIVPAHSVRRYLMAYKQKKNLHSLRVLWFPDMGHGEINFGPVGEAACTRIVSEMLRLEADFPPTADHGLPLRPTPTG